LRRVLQEKQSGSSQDANWVTRFKLLEKQQPIRNADADLSPNLNRNLARNLDRTIGGIRYQVFDNSYSSNDPGDSIGSIPVAILLEF
jgi:hypothetical protein